LKSEKRIYRIRILDQCLDVVSRLMSDARKAVKELFGSAIISRVGFRDNYVIIGKQGLPSGSAVETVRSAVCVNHTIGESSCVVTQRFVLLVQSSHIRRYASRYVL